jgi:VanZ family protein
LSAPGVGSRRGKHAALLISFLIYLGISLVSSLPGASLPSAIPDIIPHFCEYAVLAFFFIQAFKQAARPRTVAVGLAWLVLLAILDEWHQSFVPGRVCSLKDLLFDALGGLSGILAYLGWRRRSAGPRA